MIVFVVLILCQVSRGDELKKVCHSGLYCYGNVLDVIQKAQLYDDSKTFVDKKLRFNESVVLSNFDKLEDKTNESLMRFIKDNFEPEGSEFEPWNPVDWKESPNFIESIKNESYKVWAKELNLKWRHLGRDIKEHVQRNPHLYSQIYVPYPVIVPGGRFREYYYWDSFWTIRGLLLCGMNDTVKGMLKNFKYLVESLGFIPNGGRIYYLNRSQPPLYIPMVKSYIDKTDDIELLEELIDSMETEFEFWMNNRTRTVEKNGKTYRFAIYNTTTSGPRPESYSEDFNLAKDKPDEEKDDLYNELKSAAESGWDFSSRWFIDGDADVSTLSRVNTRIRSIAPVDLNSYLCGNARLLSRFNEKLGRIDKTKKYKKVYDKMMKTVHGLFWNEENGIWFDYDWVNKTSREMYYASNFAPLWTKCYDRSKQNETVQKVLTYFKNLKLEEVNIGGIPISLVESGEQWDFPNVWPPMHYLIVRGFKQSGIEEAVDVAAMWADRWIQSVYNAFNRTTNMFEKYASNQFGHYGGGGEYAVQEGFGWTNAIVLEFFSLYCQSSLTLPSIVLVCTFPVILTIYTHYYYT